MIANSQSSLEIPPSCMIPAKMAAREEEKGRNEESVRISTFAGTTRGGEKNKGLSSSILCLFCFVSALANLPVSMVGFLQVQTPEKGLERSPGLRFETLVLVAYFIR